MNSNIIKIDSIYLTKLGGVMGSLVLTPFNLMFDPVNHP